MHNFFLILLNRTFISQQATKDRIFECDSDLYSDMQNHKEEFADPMLLDSLLERSCSITKHLSINSNILPSSVIIPSNRNDIINIITHYNNTYLEYKKIAFDNTEDLICSIISKEWCDWVGEHLDSIYTKICTYRSNECIAEHNSWVLDKMTYIVSSINNSICDPNTTTNPSSSINTTNNYFNHNITNTTNDDLHLNTYDFSNPLIYWTQMVTVGAGIFTVGYCTKKIVNYIQKQCCTPNTNDNIKLEESKIVSHVHIVGTPKEAIQLYQVEQEPLYENVSTIGDLKGYIAD